MTTPTSTDIQNAIAQAAADGVQSASFGAGSSSQSAMSISDQITAMRFLQEELAKKTQTRGISFKQIQHPIGDLMPATKPILVDRFGKPLERQKLNGKSRKEASPGPRFGLMPLRARAAADPDILGNYDLAQTTTTNTNHWGQADAYDADSANSLAIRKLLVKRSRYESSNNGFVNGIVRTHATFVVRTGPTLRLLSEDEADAKSNEKKNEAIKSDWRKWCKEVNLRRNLHCMVRAKIRDGEPIAIVRNNPKLKHAVKLDMKLVETEQCTTPMLPWAEKNYIDGIKFDEFDNPTYYDILKTHPGAVNVYQSFEPEHVPAKYVLHWFELERAGQHRGIPAMTSTLGLGAGHRRFRTAVVDNAETVAQVSLVAKTQGSPISEETGESAGPDQFAPFGAVPWQRDLMMMLPMGWDVNPISGTQPSTTYDMFVREHIRELARPIGMPYNVAAADASQESFAGGKLNSIPYYMVIDDLDRLDCNDLVLDPLFALWWEEYVLVKQSDGEMKDADPEDPPDHDWDWPRNPVADMASEVGTNAERLRTGQAAPSDIAHENGESYEDLLRRLSRDYGKPVMKSVKPYFQVTSPRSQEVRCRGKRQRARQAGRKAAAVDEGEDDAAAKEGRGSGWRGRDDAGEGGGHDDRAGECRAGDAATTQFDQGSCLMATRTQKLHQQRNREALLRTSREFGLQVGEAALLAAVPWAKDEEKEDEEEEENRSGEGSQGRRDAARSGRTACRNAANSADPWPKRRQPQTRSPPKRRPKRKRSRKSRPSKLPPSRTKKPSTRNSLTTKTNWTKTRSTPSASGRWRRS